VGRLWTGKGLSDLLDAFGRLQRETGGEVSLLLIGDGVDEQLLRSRVEAERIRNVVFAGFQHDDVLPRLYAASDAFVFPTLGDPFGMVVLEAMACGLPVIATTAAGEIADRVVDGVNGFVVSPADPHALHDRLALLARDRELRQRMGRASIEKVAGQSPAAWAGAFEQAVETIVGMPRVGEHRSTEISDRHASSGSGVQ
jgi:glycosyltransferase involved in cell wall biosynthesis